MGGWAITAWGGIVVGEDEDNVKQDDAPLAEGGMSEREVDKNLEDSFPASDPPSWTLGTNHREEEGEKKKRS